MKALVGAFNQEKALVGAFSVIVQPVVEPMEHYTALIVTHYTVMCAGIPPILTSPEQVKQEITITLCFRTVMMDNRDYQCL